MKHALFVFVCTLMLVSAAGAATTWYSDNFESGIGSWTTTSGFSAASDGSDTAMFYNGATTGSASKVIGTTIPLAATSVSIQWDTQNAPNSNWVLNGVWLLDDTGAGLGFEIMSSTGYYEMHVVGTTDSGAHSVLIGRDTPNITGYSCYSVNHVTFDWNLVNKTVDRVMNGSSVVPGYVNPLGTWSDASKDFSKIVVYGTSYDVPGIFVDNLNVSYVPEPASMLLLGLGTLGVLARRRRR